MLSFGLLVVLLLYLIFPQKYLMQQVLRTDRADSLSASYLTTLLRTDPLNADLRLTLAQQQLRLGRYADAEAALRPLTTTINVGDRLRARRLQYEIQEAEAYALPQGSAERVQAIAALVPRLKSLTSEPWDNVSLAVFAEKALALGDRRQGLDLYQRLVARASEDMPEWLGRTAELSLAQGEYQAAADLYFAAQARAATLAGKRIYFQLALTTLQSGNRLQDALDQADARIGELADDRDTLIFLVRLARSANRPDLAEKYARQLLRMALWRTYRQLAALEDFRPAAYWPGGRFIRAGSAGTEMLPFDDEAYTLAYEAFLGNRNLADALRVAEAAVRQRPQHATWRERLARVAEWSGKPELALENWLHLAEETGQAAAWQSVLRLAPGLFDDATLLKALRWQATQRPPSDSQWRDLAAAYERLGQPREATAFFEAQYRRRPQRIHLELIADLAERSGDDALALATLDRLAGQFGTSPKLALRQAALLYVQGDLAGAYRRLEAAKARASPETSEFWQVYGDLAQQLQRDDEAIAAYRNLLDSGRYREQDLGRLIQALRVSNPMEAARIAELGWRRFDRPSFMISALDLHTAEANWQRVDQLFASLTGEQERLLRRDGYFLVLSAQHHRRLGHFNEAKRDWFAALELDPASTSLREGLLWFLIERKDRRELRRLVAAWKDDTALSEPLAAAYVTLGEPAKALAYYRRQLVTKRDDYLWLMAYADALEQARETAAAERVRRHVWQTLRGKPATESTEQDDLRRQETVARLAQQFAPGDLSLALLRQLLRRDREVGPAATKNTAGAPNIDSARELALAWALSHEATDLAEAWLLARYAGTVARPGWAELSLALQGDDRDRLDRLLTTRPDELPLYDRINAARRLGRDGEAASLAFEGLEASPADEELHSLLSDSLPRQTGRWAAGAASARLGALDERHINAWAALPLWPRWRLQTGFERFEWRSRDAAAIGGLPVGGNRVNASVTRDWEDGSVRALLGRRDALASVTEAALNFEQKFGSRLSATVEAQRNFKPTESAALIVGGSKDSVAGGVGYTPGKREYVNARLEVSRFYSQERTSLGSGRQFQFEAGYKLRTEYPDYTVRLSGVLQNYTADGQLGASLLALAPANSNPALGFALPENQRYLSLNFGYGGFFRESYTRALRPFLDIGLSHNSVSGFGYNLLAGASVSLVGHDHLSAHVSTGSGGTGAFSRTQEIGLTYQYFFDRY